MSRILSPPVLRTAGNAAEKRGASWLELFFDLVFVVAVAQLAVALGDDLSPGGVARFLLLFVPIWWAWVGYTMYADRFDTDDVAFRILMFAGMLGIAGLAVIVPSAFSGDSEAFAVAYVAVRAVLVLLYDRARRQIPEVWALCTVTMAVFAAGSALWAVSVLIPEPWRFGFWVLALLLEGATPWVARRAMVQAPVHAHHLPERFGLFTIIVLGESLVAVVIGLGGTDWTAASAFVAAAVFVVAACLWWVYFDVVDLAGAGGGLFARNAFIYGHLPIALGLTAAGVGAKKAIGYAAGASFPAGGAWALFGGTALFLLGVSIVHAISIGRVREGIVAGRVVVAIGAVLLASIAVALPTIVLVGALLFMLIGLIAFEVNRNAPTGDED